MGFTVVITLLKYIYITGEGASHHPLDSLAFNQPHPRHPFEAKNQAALLIKILRGQLLGCPIQNKTNHPGIWIRVCVFFVFCEKKGGKHIKDATGVCFFLRIFLLVGQ